MYTHVHVRLQSYRHHTTNYVVVIMWHAAHSDHVHLRAPRDDTEVLPDVSNSRHIFEVESLKVVVPRLFKAVATRMWADAQRDGRPAEYR